MDISGRYIVQKTIRSDTATYVDIVIYSPNDLVESGLRIGSTNGEERSLLFNEPWYGVRLTPNRVYLPAAHCNESSTCTADLYAIDASGLQGDYSRLPLIQ